ncbi:hypothetical protein D1872_315790 [compost metagenome]
MDIVMNAEKMSLLINIPDQLRMIGSMLPYDKKRCLGVILFQQPKQPWRINGIWPVIESQGKIRIAFATPEYPQTEDATDQARNKGIER